MRSLTFCHPAISQFLIAAIFFVIINCKELKFNCSNCSNLPAILIFEQVLFVYITTSSVCYLVC